MMFTFRQAKISKTARLKGLSMKKKKKTRKIVKKSLGSTLLHHYTTTLQYSKDTKEKYIVLVKKKLQWFTHFYPLPL